MTAEGFLNQKQRHPVAMTVAVGINLAAVVAVMLAKNDFIPPVPTILVGGNIPLPTDPPEKVEREKPRVKQVEQPTPYTPDRVVKTGQIENGNDVKGTELFPPMGGDSGGSEQARKEPETRPEPLPVLTDAAPLASAARDFQPPYPPQLLRTNVEGKAVVRVLIGADGRVKQVAIIAADDPLFADATERQALRRWRFKPATRDGVAVETWKQMTVRFEIRA